MTYYLFLIELFAIVLYVVPKLIWNFFKYRTVNGALKIRIALSAIAILKIGQAVEFLTNPILIEQLVGWWSFGSTAAFISLFVLSELPHENKQRGHKDI